MQMKSMCTINSYTSFSCFIRGASDIKDEKKKILVEKRTQSLAQNAIYACLTPRQVLNETSEAFYNTHELPQQLAVGLAVHQATRSEKLLQLSHGFVLSVDHTRILKIETRIAMEEIRRMEMNGGAYLPPDISLGRFLLFAVDNVDFSEDTPDVKRTLHGTAMAIYQRYKEGDVTKPLKFTEATLTSSLTQIPRTVTELLPCHVPGNVKPKISSHKKFKLEEKYRLSGYETDDLAWLFAKTLHFKNEIEKPNQCDIQETTLVERGGDTAELIDKAILGNDDHLLCELQQNTEEAVLVYATRSKNVPTWSSYNSVLNHSQPLTKVSMPLLIAAPSHEFSTLLTIFRQAERIKTVVVGVNQKTVITLDMGFTNQQNSWNML